jgi:polyphosphate glucokinase
MTSHTALEPTLSIDVGGSGLKAAVVDVDGTLRTERVRIPTPYPCPPDVLVKTLTGLVEPLVAQHIATRTSVGIPGMVRGGRVLSVTPLARRVYGGPREPDLIEAWSDYPLADALTASTGLPTKVVNDADMQGCAVVEGVGFEFVVTLGTGVGTAVFNNGHLLPHMELSHTPFRDGLTIDAMIGNHNREQIGDKKWVKRVREAIDVFDDLLWFDRLYVGGGNAKLLTAEDVGPKGRIVPNKAGIIGGVRVWEFDV